MEKATISINLDRAHYLYYIRDKMKDSCVVKKMRVYKANGRVYLTMEHVLDELISFDTLVNDLVCDVIIYGEKYELVTSGLIGVRGGSIEGNEKNLPLIDRTIINAMVLYECKEDRLAISDSITEIDGLCIDGLINFRLHSIVNKWKEDIDAVVSNGLMDNGDSIKYEFLSYLTKGMRRNSDFISIDVKYGQFQMHLRELKLLKVLPIRRINCKIEDNILFNLLYYMPKKAEIHGKRSRELDKLIEFIY